VAKWSCRGHEPEQSMRRTRPCKATTRRSIWQAGWPEIWSMASQKRRCRAPLGSGGRAVACGRRPPVAKAELGARGNDSVRPRARCSPPMPKHPRRRGRPPHRRSGDTKTLITDQVACEVTKKRGAWSAREPLSNLPLQPRCPRRSQVAAPRPSSACRPPWPSGQVVIGLPVDLLRDDGSHA